MTDRDLAAEIDELTRRANNNDACVAGLFDQLRGVAIASGARRVPVRECNPAEAALIRDYKFPQTVGLGDKGITDIGPEGRMFLSCAREEGFVPETEDGYCTMMGWIEREYVGGELRQLAEAGNRNLADFLTWRKAGLADGRWGHQGGGTS